MYMVEFTCEMWIEGKLISWVPFSEHENVPKSWCLWCGLAYYLS